MPGRKRNPTDRFKEYKAKLAKRPNTATSKGRGVSFHEAPSLEIPGSPEPTPGSPGPSGGSSDVFTMTEPRFDVRPPLQNCMSEVENVKHKYNVLRDDVLVELTQCGEYMAEKHFLVQAALGKHDQNCKALLDAEMKKTADAVKEVSELKSSTSASGKQRMDSAKSAAPECDQGGASSSRTLPTSPLCKVCGELHLYGDPCYFAPNVETHIESMKNIIKKMRQNGKSLPVSFKNPKYSKAAFIVGPLNNIGKNSKAHTYKIVRVNNKGFMYIHLGSELPVDRDNLNPQHHCLDCGVAWTRHNGVPLAKLRKFWLQHFPAEYKKEWNDDPSSTNLSEENSDGEPNGESDMETDKGSDEESDEEIHDEPEEELNEELDDELHAEPDGNSDEESDEESGGECGGESSEDSEGR